MKHWAMAHSAPLMTGYTLAYAGEEKPQPAEEEEGQGEAAAVDEGGGTVEETTEEGEVGEGK